MAPKQELRYVRGTKPLARLGDKLLDKPDLAARFACDFVTIFADFAFLAAQVVSALLAAQQFAVLRHPKTLLRAFMTFHLWHCSTLFFFFTCHG